MNDYWLLAPTLATSLVAVAFALLWRKEHEEYRILASDFKGVVAHCKQIEQERDDAREKLRTQETFSKIYVKENEQLTVRNADLRDALKEAQDEAQRWQRQTAQMPEAIPARPKRPSKKKEVVEDKQ